MVNCLLWNVYLGLWLSEVESRTQGSRPRTQKNSETKDTGASVLQKKKKKVFKNFFSGDLHLRKAKKSLRKFSARFPAFINKLSTVQKIVLSSSRGQGNFRGQGLQNVSSRPRTSSRTPPHVAV